VASKPQLKAIVCLLPDNLLSILSCQQSSGYTKFAGNLQPCLADVHDAFTLNIYCNCSTFSGCGESQSSSLTSVKARQHHKKTPPT